MQLTTLILFAAMMATGAAAQAHERVDCDRRGCKAPPPPPIAPLPPMPAIPAAPPLPPAPPAPPEVPESAHLACASKAVGAKLSFIPAKDELMTGICKRDDKGMYFSMRSYQSRH